MKLGRRLGTGSQIKQTDLENWTGSQKTWMAQSKTAF